MMTSVDFGVAASEPGATLMATAHSLERPAGFRLAPAAATLASSSALLAGMLTGTTTSAPLPLLTARFAGSWMSATRVIAATDTRVLILASAPSTAARLSPADPGRTSDPDHLVSEAESVRWLHEESGLTWDQLGRVFGVSRRAVHLWANGSRMNSVNAATLADLVGVVRELPAARAPADRRARLLAAGPDGRSVLDEIRARHSDADTDISGTGWAPQELLGALHDKPRRT